MMILIIGGARSGKSEYAERRAMQLSDRRVYVATSEVFDEEMAHRVELHRSRREGLGFTTIERARDLGGLELPEGCCVLIESLSVWLANEMFGAEGVDVRAGEKVYSEVLSLRERAEHVVLVSDDVFSDGVSYDDLTEKWRRELGRLHVRLAVLADEVVEVVAGLPVIYKPARMPD